MNSDLSLLINEIFFSIQGESSLTGWPTVFVRTTGCNLRCTYCDTKYSYFEGSRKSFSELFEEIRKYSAKYICLTGGEPLAQPNSLEFMKQLCDQGYQVSLETSGSYDTRAVDFRVIKVIDVKTPASGEVKSFDENNFEWLTEKDQLKFVLCDELDYAWAKEFVLSKKIFEKCTVFFSPAFDTMPIRTLAEKILVDRLPVRLQVQLHKYIWSAHHRGV